MRELAAAPANTLQHDQGSLTLASGWPPASPLRPTTEDPTKSRERRHAAQSRVVKSHRNNGKMWPELRSSVARIAVKCIGIRSMGCWRFQGIARNLDKISIS